MTSIAKSANTHSAAKTCCGWEEPAICLQVFANSVTNLVLDISMLLQLKLSDTGRICFAYCIFHQE